MYLRTYLDSDAPAVIDLVIDTFRPFYEQSFPAMVAHDQVLIEHQHGQWEQDYRDDVPTLHDPERGARMVVAVHGDDPDEGAIIGCLSWKPDSRPAHAEIYLVAVDRAHRRSAVGRSLMEHALTALRAEGYRFVGLGTGGDAFHAPARRLYDELGFHPIPIVGYLRTL